MYNSEYYVIKFENRYILSKNYTVQNLDSAHKFTNLATAKAFIKRNFSDMDLNLKIVKRRYIKVRKIDPNVKQYLIYV